MTFGIRLRPCVALAPVGDGAMESVELMAKERADRLLVQRGLAETRSRAQALILAGKVYTSDRRIEKAGQTLDVEAPLAVRGEQLRYVSRGGLKLEGALDAFGYAVRGKIVADFGASTGGFTDCVLQRGAARVYAVDVGWGQLHNRLRQDERVVNMERTNARHLEALDDPIELVVIDASFIGLAKLLPAVHRVLRGTGDLLAMVKPQFEVGRSALGKGGVVRDEAQRVQAIDAVAEEARALGFEERGRHHNTVIGPKGNREAFLWLALR